MKMFHFSLKEKRIFIGAIFAIFGFYIIYLTSHMRMQLDEMNKWPSAKAYIVSAGTASAVHKSSPTGYKQKLKYTYTINGKTYTNDHIAYGSQPEWGSESDAKKDLPKIGAEISIRFDPKNPSKSAIYISTMDDMDEKLGNWLGGIVISIGILIFFSGLRTSNEDEKGNLDIAPTMGVQIFASSLAFIIFLLASTLLYFAASTFYENHQHLNALIVVFVLFLGSVVLLLRTAFTKPRKLSAKAMLFTGYFCVAFGVLGLCVAIRGSGNVLGLAGCGFMGISYGIRTIKRCKQLGTV